MRADARHPLSNSLPQSGRESRLVTTDNMTRKMELYTQPAPLPDEGWKEMRHTTAARAKVLRQNQTDAETAFWHEVKAKRFYGHKFRRQFPIGPYFVDFACIEQKLVVEIDGGQHCENQKDETRTAYLKQEGFTLLRFWNNEVLNNLDGVLETLKNQLENLHGPQ